MFIQDLNHLEVVSEETNIEGGRRGSGAAFADAYSNAYASGRNFAQTFTSTYTDAHVSRWGTSTSSNSCASSVAF
ncbi:hypothetical protein [Planktothrix agardhii]|jgi:hypothetical protein|uniref:Uncharacterized protein n=1 Tax=Planktothrix agardhii TaxID=1160 RepID=A0AAD1Q2Q5_PLAAG|nr:hypothetical protein [Planktothrix agardhii]MDS1348335.1 hypothetical protein [Planktothrix agardhii NRERC-751]CAD5929596.1 hypothetical protein PANO66_01257 [Planktothrix agardhii]